MNRGSAVTTTFITEDFKGHRGRLMLSGCMNRIHFHTKSLSGLFKYIILFVFRIVVVIQWVYNGFTYI